MADDIGADDFTSFTFNNEYGSEAASVVIKETGKRSRNSDDSFKPEEKNKKKRKKQRTNKISKFIKDRDESQTIRTAPIQDQTIYLQGTCYSALRGITKRKKCDQVKFPNIFV